MLLNQVFTKATNKNVLTDIILSLFIFVCFTGCKKDLSQEPDSPFSNTIQNRSEESNPTVTHQMLHFNSFADMSAFIQVLKTREADTAQVRIAYTALGINVNAETFPNLTDYPICLRTEQAIGGYLSARKSEETVINTALDNGDDNINSIVIFPFWKTVLNSDYSINIGNRIYKYYDNGGIAIILNNDWTLYNTIKAQTFESLNESFNLIVTSDAREGWDKYFTFNNDESINTEKSIFMPNFTATNTTDGKLAISNNSLVETTIGVATFKWIYSDNTTSFGQNPNRTFTSTEALKLIIDNGTGTKDTLTDIANILACTTNYFTITYLANNQIRFELPGYNTSDPNNQYTLKWEFSDGQTSITNPTLNTFSAPGNATCKLFRKNDGTLACYTTKPYTAKCGEKKSAGQTRQYTQCGQKWKLDGSIWVQTGEVGCKVKYLKKVLFFWLPASNQGACTNLSGTYIREVYNPNQNCIDITATGSYCLGNGTFPTSISYTIPEVPNVFNKPGQLSAGLGIKVCGVWIGWGYGGFPRLVLP